MLRADRRQELSMTKKEKRLPGRKIFRSCTQARFAVTPVPVGCFLRVLIPRPWTPGKRGVRAPKKTRRAIPDSPRSTHHASRKRNTNRSRIPWHDGEPADGLDTHPDNFNALYKRYMATVFLPPFFQKAQFPRAGYLRSPFFFIRTYRENAKEGVNPAIVIF